MKLMTRTGIYKSANVTFKPETKIATSYDWWTFVKVINGKLIFNDYNYSNTTRKHQYKVRHLLNELGLVINREVQIKSGLQNIVTLKQLNAAENETLDAIKAEAEEKRVARNERAQQRRAAKRSAERALANDGKRVLGLV